MSGHTAGPWEWSGEPGSSHLRGPRSETYQGVLGYADYEGMWPSMHDAETDAANMSLIAAAPDLLKELEHLVALIEPLERGGGQLNIPGLATLNGARAAIKKAKGE